jgi:DNA-binding NarL/FixJ family response regulator
MIRDALCYLLEAEGDIQVIATAADGQEAVEQAGLQCPDVAVMDISRIREGCPHTRVVMLTIYNNQEHIERAKQVGASGYVLKDAAGRELLAAVRALYKGGSYFGSNPDGPRYGAPNS